MLRSFRVANHKSFRDEAELLLMPAYDKSRPVVPVAGIFGANASGKSNLLDALHWMQTAVRESYAHWEPSAGVPRTPFRLDPESAAKPSLYCVEIIIDGSRYTYGLEVDDERVREEWLYTYPHNRRRVIFQRERDTIRLGSTVPDHRARSEQLARQTRDNALFLGVAAQNAVDHVQPIYEWFRSGVRFADGDETAEAELARRLDSEPERTALVELIRAADLGIRDVKSGQYVKLRDGAVPASDVRDRAGEDDTADMLVSVFATWDIQFSHGRSDATLGLYEQSAGTRSWIGLVSVALSTLGSGGVMVVDEVDASLHPHLTTTLINLFRNSETNIGGAQLLLTTHDATLLDEDALARDEIWFVEKEPDSGATRLYPLTDFHPRKNENTEGRYLAGGYGAIPVLSQYRFRKALRAGRSSDAAA